MLFLRPLLLWGILGAAVPLLIHLLGRRRVRTVPIATLRFLERARARASAHWRLRRILLLLVRALTLAGLALLFAGPGCQEPGAASGHGTWVLLLDTSPSMAAGRAEGSSLGRGKRDLLRLIDRAEARDRFLFATTAVADEGAWRRGFSADAAALREEVLRAEVAYGDHRVERALERAFQLLEGMPEGRVALATDLQASGWGEGRIPGAGKVPLQLFDVGLPEPRNTWVAGVDESGAGVRARLRSAGASESGRRRTVKLELDDGQVAAAFVTGLEATFQIREPSAGYTGAVRVEPGGDLPLDDVYAFVGKGTGRVRLLLLNGDPRGFQIRDELFFVRRALGAGGRLDEAFEAREVRVGEASAKDLEWAQVILLANPALIGGAVAAGLQKAVERGAGLVVTAGDRWNPQEGSGALAPLLAAPLRDVITHATDDPSRRPYESLDAAFFPPPLEGFRDRATADLSRTRVWTYWALDRGTSAAAETWMRLENGAPLLVRRRLGRGSTLLLATTIDRDGSDLCLQSAFIPWLERILLSAAGRLGPRVESRLSAGFPVSLPYREAVTIQGPRDQRSEWRPNSPPFVPAEPGIYQVFSADRRIDTFAAGLPDAESDLTRLAPPALDARLGKGNYGLGEERAVSPAAEGTGRRDVSGRVAAALVALLALEALLSSRLGRKPAEIVVGGAP